MKRYAVHPGWIRDAWISFERLIELYDVPKDECIRWDLLNAMELSQSKYIHLHPQPSGIYHKPKI